MSSILSDRTRTFLVCVKHPFLWDMCSACMVQTALPTQNELSQNAFLWTAQFKADLHMKSVWRVGTWGLIGELALHHRSRWYREFRNPENLAKKVRPVTKGLRNPDCKPLHWWHSSAFSSVIAHLKWRQQTTIKSEESWSISIRYSQSWMKFGIVLSHPATSTLRALTLVALAATLIDFLAMIV